MTVRHLLPELILAVGAAAVLIVALFVPRRRHGLCGVLAALIVMAAAGAVIWLQMAEPQTLTMHDDFARDGVTAAASYIVLASSALVILMSPRWFASDRRHGEWYVMVLLATIGALLLAGATDLMQLMVSMLLLSVAGYTLASYHRASAMCAEAGAKLYFLGALANPLLFVGIVLVYGLAGSTDYQTVRAALALPGAGGVALSFAVALIFVGLAFELGVAPIHPWVPDVAQGSPAPAAAFLTVVPKVAALIALVRLCAIIPDSAVAWRPTIAVVAAVTMTLGNLAAMWQTDVRRLLGWSSVAQAGYGLMAAVAVGRSDLTVSALIVFTSGYALANLCAFAVVVSLRGRTSLDDYRGLFRVRPGHAVAMTLALLSLTGIPPLIGFAGKLGLFGAVIAADYAWLAVVAVVNTVVSLFYYLRVIAAMLAPDGRRVALLGGTAAWSVVVAAALVVLLGLSAQPLFDGAQRAALLPL